MEQENVEGMERMERMDGIGSDIPHFLSLFGFILNRCLKDLSEVYFYIRFIYVSSGLIQAITLNGMTPLIGTLGNAPYSDNNVRTFCNTSATVLRGKLHINSAPLARQSKFLT
jgi:hypothetical protein